MAETDYAIMPGNNLSVPIIFYLATDRIFSTNPMKSEQIALEGLRAVRNLENRGCVQTQADIDAIIKERERLRLMLNKARQEMRLPMVLAAGE